MARKKVTAIKAEIMESTVESAVVDLPDIKPMVTFDVNQVLTVDMELDASASASISKVEQADGDFSDLTPVPSEQEEEEFTPKKTRKPRKPRVYEEIVYDIPEVEKKPLTHAKGVRYGYACLNTVLRNKKPAKDSIFCSRTLRLATLKKEGVDFMKELGRQNALDLVKMIEWNEENKIRFFRISSEMCARCWLAVVFD
jgi:hypothetical protein